MLASRKVNIAKRFAKRPPRLPWKSLKRMDDPYHNNITQHKNLNKYKQTIAYRDKQYKKKIKYW